MEVELRPARWTDPPIVLGLLEGASLPVAGVEASLDRFVVAEASGRIVGAAGLEVHGEDGLLRWVGCIRPLGERDWEDG